MRLWNLVTGKKAGVLSFERELLQSVGEGKWASGEGQKVKWSPEGDEFAVLFDRGAVVFGMDSKPKCLVLPTPASKLHQLSYVSTGISKQAPMDLIAVSTEDGRILFFSSDVSEPGSDIPHARLVAQLGGKSAGSSNRIKDFEILDITDDNRSSIWKIIVTGSSDGSIRLWKISKEELAGDAEAHSNGHSKGVIGDAAPAETGVRSDAVHNNEPRQIGQLLGSQETGNRITCIRAFVLLPSEASANGAENGAEKGGSDEEFKGLSSEDDGEAIQ